MAIVGKELTGKVVDQAGRHLTTARITFDEFLKRYEGQHKDYLQ